MQKINFFNVLRLQAAITPQLLQLLQIDGNSLSNDPSMGCLVSIFTVGINSKSFPWPVHSTPYKKPSANFLRRRTPVDGTPHSDDGLSGRGLMTSSGHAHLDSHIDSRALRAKYCSVLWVFHTIQPSSFYFCSSSISS